MYYRSQGYPYSKKVNLPPNYGGNAFYGEEPEPRNTAKTTERESEIIKEDYQEDVESFAEEVPPPPSHPEKSTPASIFQNNSFLGGKIGSEELLLLAVIFLISGSEGNDDILWLLILLLFIK